MNLRCPDCCSEEVQGKDSDAGAKLVCGNCGAQFDRDSALVTVADAEAYADEQSACTCGEVRGCPQCFQKADDLVGATVRDSQGRVWEVSDVGEKDGFPTISCEHYWDRPDEVTVLKAAA